ncbi:hypothetical protein B566_EDAN018322 [Ephemera danica]|nr:hypothetical protein B566_EDAN018322 [Ephemera danica]
MRIIPCLENEEENKCISYVKANTSTDTFGAEISLYVCNRDGDCRLISAGFRQTKSQGTSKISATCPSIMKCSWNGKMSKCSVEYVLTHVGHDTESGHVRIPKSGREMIIDK